MPPGLLHAGKSNSGIRIKRVVGTIMPVWRNVIVMDNAMLFYKPGAGQIALHGVIWAIRLRRPRF